MAETTSVKKGARLSLFGSASDGEGGTGIAEVDKRVLTVVSAACLLSLTVFGGIFIARGGGVTNVRTLVVSLVALLVLLACLWLRAGTGGTATAVRCFPVVLVFLGVVYGLFFPIGSIPDEGYHFIRAYAYSNLLLPGVEADSVRLDDLDILFDPSVSSGEVSGLRLTERSMSPLQWEAMGDDLRLGVEDASLVSYQNLDASIAKISNNLAWVRLPAALGIALGRALRLGSLPTFYLGRLVSLLYTVALISLAIRLAPTGQCTFMAVSLLPITVQQVMSYSYDGPIVGYAFLLTALLLRGIFGHGTMGRGLEVGIVVTACLLAPLKMIYVLLSFAVLLIPNDRFPERRGATVFKAGVIAASLVMCVLPHIGDMLLLSSNSGGFEAGAIGAEAGFSSEPKMAYSIPYVLGHPSEIVALYARTFTKYAGLYVGTTVGTLFGLTEHRFTMPLWFVLLLVAYLLAANVGDREDGTCMTGRQRALSLVLCFLETVAVLAGMMLTWTAVGSDVIEGVQGRYFLPYLPLLLLALRPSRLRTKVSLGPSTLVLGLTFGLSVINYLAFVVTAM